MELAKLVTDLEKEPRTDVTFLFSARYDCDHDPHVIEYVAQKFPVVTHRTRRVGDGWPAGPNQLMADSYEFFVTGYGDVNLPRRPTVDGQDYAERLYQEAIRSLPPKKFLDIETMLLMEADALPLHRNWINLIMEEHVASGKLVSGSWLVNADGGGEHVNGNCLINKQLGKSYPQILNPPNFGGWDALAANIILPNANPSRLIFSDYHLGTDRNPWKGCDYLWEPKVHTHPRNPLYNQPISPVYIHGPKDMRGIECVRNKLLS